MNRRIIFLVPVASMLMAWGAKPPEYMRDVTKIHEDYPKSTHICGLGSVAKSVGPQTGPKAAQQNAKADVSRQISSQLQGEAQSVLRTSVRGKKIEMSQGFVEKVVERFASQKDLVPLMMPVHSWTPKGKYKQYMSYVCMDRDAGGGAILARIAPTKQKLTKAAELAGRANTMHSVSEFAVHYATARRAGGEIFDDWVQLRVVSARQAQLLEAELNKLDSLRATAAEWRKNQIISVVIDDSAGDGGAIVQGKARQALQMLDVLAAGAAKSCKDPDGSTHVLKITPEPRCKRGHVVLSCQVDFDVRIEHCESGDVGGGRVESKTFKGTDNQFDERRAKERAWDKVSAEGLLPGLKDILGTQLPLD